MKYGYNLDANHAAAIFELDTPASVATTHAPDTKGLIVGGSEWVWLTEDNARRICAALTYFSDTATADIERFAKG